MVASDGKKRDRVDKVMDQVAELNHAVDVVSKGLCYRVLRIAQHIESELRKELAHYGIGRWELEVLAALNRAEPGKTLTAGALMEDLLLTSGAVTKRVASLEGKGWVRREVDLSDRRQVLVSLTELGAERAQQMLKVRTETEVRLSSGLSAAARCRMNEELRALLIAIEGPFEG